MGWWGAPSFTAAVLRIQHVNVYHADVLCTKRRSRTVRKRTHPSQSFVVLPRPSPHPRLHPAASPAHPPNPQANHHIPMSDGCASSGGRGRPAAAGESATRRRDTPTQYSPLVLPSFHVLPACSSRFLAVCHVCHTTAQRKKDPLPPPATESAFSTQFQFLKRVDTVVKCVRSVCGVCAMADGGGDDAAGGDVLRRRTRKSPWRQ